MACRQPLPIVRVLSAAPPWVFLLTGLAIVVGHVLTPARRELNELRYRQEALVAEADALKAARDRERRTLLAIRGNDPLVLERAAAIYLRRTPPGRFVIDDFEPGLPDMPEPPGLNTRDRDIRLAQLNRHELRPAWRVASEPRREHAGGPDQATEDQATDPLLAAIPPVILRLLTGPSRYALLTMAGILILLGLMPTRPPMVEVEDALDDDGPCDWDEDEVDEA